MKKVLITMLLLSVFVVVSCITDETDDTGNTGDSGDTDDTGESCEHGEVKNCVDFDSFERCVDGSWETISLKHKGLEWSCSSPDRMYWDDAISYCTGLGGRLPKIQELRMLIKDCPKTEYPKPDGQDPWCEIEDPDKLASGDWTNACSGCAFDSSGKYSVFGDKGVLWSSSPHVNYTNGAWHVSFNYGYVRYHRKTVNLNAWCVR